MAPEVQLLAGKASALEIDYAKDGAAWAGSPFAWIKTRPSRQIGAIGEKIVSEWLGARGFSVSRSPDSDADRLVEKLRVEIKFSTLWANGSYKFQQLRDQRYDFAICLGVSPFDAHCWVIEKSEIMRHWRETGNLHSQHGGAAGSDTAWLSVDPASPQPWVRGYGGTLREGLARVAQLTGFEPEPQE